MVLIDSIPLSPILESNLASWVEPPKWLIIDFVSSLVLTAERSCTAKSSNVNTY